MKLKSIKKKLAVLLTAAVCLSASGCGDTGIGVSKGGVSDTESEYTVIDGDSDFYEDGEEESDSGKAPGSYDYEDIYEDETSAEEAADTEIGEDDIFSEDDEQTEQGSAILIEPYTRTADVSRYSKNIVENMTRDEKAAQLILARCPGEGAAALMEQYNFGGYTLYGVDFADRDRDGAAEFISQIVSAAETAPFIAVDEEGGEVVRVSKYPAYRDVPFDSIQSIYSSGGLDGLAENAREKAELLTGLGINLNLAPVADIASEGDYIYGRTLGAGAEDTAAAVRQIIDTSGENGLMSCIKHFPGYGSNADTHTGVSRDSRSLEDLRNKDLIPFRKGIASGYSPAVLVNHNIIECLDSERPASLSPAVHKTLREELGFYGVIITDDLGMDGINAYTGEISPYVMGIIAGNDMLCVSEPEKAFSDIRAAMENGTLPMEVVDEHVRRVIQMKSDGGIL